MKSLAKNSLYNAVYQVLNLIFPLISSMYVARVLSPDGVGRVAYAQNIASYFSTAAALGIPTVGLRVISVARDNRAKLNQEFSELAILNAVLTSVSVICYFAVIFCIPAFRADLRLYFAAGLVVAFNYINIDWLYQGHEEYGYIVARNIVTKVLSIGALLLFVKSKEDYLTYAVITSLATCGNYLFNAIRARKLVTPQFRNLHIRRHIKPVFLLGISLFLNAIYGKVDTTMLGVMAGEASVGYYSYAHKVLQIATSFCAAVTAAFLPRLSYYFEHDKERFHALVARGVQIASFLAFPAATGLFLLAPEAIEVLFGADFLPAAQTLRVFSVMILISAFGNLLCYQMMICSGNEKKLVPILSGAAILNVMLNSLLIPKLQQDGAAIASVCTELFINGIEVIYTTRKLKLRYDWKVIGQGVFASIIMGVCILVLKQLISGSLLSFVCCICAGVAIYACVNVFIKNQFTMEVLSALSKKIGLHL